MNFKFTKSDFYLFALYFLFAVPILLLDDYDYSKSWLIPIGETAVYILLNGFSAYVLVFIFFPRFFPSGRYISLFVSLILLLLVTGIISINIFCLFHSCNAIPLTFKATYLGFVTQVEAMGMLSCIILGKKLFDSQLNFTRMEKEKKESELMALKSQIDPHFLFNNLNTLDSLIEFNPKSAKVYLKKLAELYRYLIWSKDQEVVLLEEELDFARNYLYLISCRFGDAYRIVFDDQTERKDHLYVPPGALQALLENIVKHNQASSAQPIEITISISEEKVIVSNNIRAKASPGKSTGIGLTNLKARYKLLTDQDIVIHANRLFTVELPTIKQVA